MTDKMREAFINACKEHGPTISFYDFEMGWDACMEQAAQSVPVVGEPVAYLHADKGGKVLWSESCVCEDAVWPHIDDDDTDQSLPVYRQPTHSITAAELERLRKDAERYRWLRMKGAQSDNLDKVHYFGPRLDEAIDAAIAAEGEKK